MEEKVIGNLPVSVNAPTKTTRASLKSWVVWQFPILHGQHLCAAAFPFGSETGWIPTLVNHTNDNVIIYGHVRKSFSTPEEAAEWVRVNG